MTAPDAVANAIIAAAKQHNFTPERTIAALATAIQESNLGEADPNVYQQDASYPNRGTLIGNIDGFFDRLTAKITSPGASSDIWLNIFWLQQAPGYSTAADAYTNGRQAYLTEIKSRIGAATDIYNQLARSSNMIPQQNINLANQLLHQYLGDDYVYGGTGPGGSNPGFDCSAWVDFILYAVVNGTTNGFVRNLNTLSWVPGGGSGPFGTIQVDSPQAFPNTAAVTIAIHHEGGGEADHMNCAVRQSNGQLILMECSGSYGVCTNGTPGPPQYGGAIPQNDPYWTDWWYLAGPVMTMMTIQGLDYAGGRPAGVDIAKAGYKFVCRYVFNDTSGQLPSKFLIASEAQDLLSAGVDIVSNWESSGTVGAGFVTGVSDAQQANANHLSAGGPAAAPIYFSVDYDAPESDQPVINAYFQGVASVIGLSRTAAYGGYWVLKRLFDAGLISYGWQTEAWSGDPGGLGPDDPFGDGFYCDPRVSIYQRNTVGYVNLGGVQCDVDVALTANFGSWKTYTNNQPAPFPPQPDPPAGYVNSSAGAVEAKLDGIDPLTGEPYAYRLVEQLAEYQGPGVYFPSEAPDQTTASALDQIATLTKIIARVADGKDALDLLVDVDKKLDALAAAPTPVPAPVKPDVVTPPAPQPAPTPAPPAPTPPPGKNSLGPSEWLAVGGVVINGAIYTLQQVAHLLPPIAANAAIGLVSLLTLLGVYHAPSGSKPAPVKEPKQPTPAPAPQPVPQPAPAPPNPAPEEPSQSTSVADALTRAAEQARQHAENAELDAINDEVNKTLGE